MNSEPLRLFLGCRCKSKHNLCASAEMSICEKKGGAYRDSPMIKGFIVCEWLMSS